MNDLQIEPINLLVTINPRFWPFFSQKMPFLRQKYRFLVKNAALLPISLRYRLLPKKGAQWNVWRHCHS